MTASLEEEAQKLREEIGPSFNPPAGANCFLDQERVCSADCVAWNKEYDKQFANDANACVLLISVAQIRHALIAICNLTKKKLPEQLYPPPPRVSK